MPILDADAHNSSTDGPISPKFKPIAAADQAPAMGSNFGKIGPSVAELWASASAVWGGGSLMKSFVRCRIFGEGVSSVHALPPKNVTLVCRFVPVLTVTFFASHEDWGRYHAPSKILPNTSLV